MFLRLAAVALVAGLAGCAVTPPDPMRCAERPLGFPVTAWFEMTEENQRRIDEIEAAAGRNADRLDGLINGEIPGSCPVS